MDINKPAYWKHARSWALAHTKTYTLPRAAPPVLSALLQYFFLRAHPIAETFAIAAIIVGGYIFLYWLEFTWKLLFAAPRELHRQQCEALGLERQMNLSLKAEVEDLKMPKRTAAQEGIYQDVKTNLLPKHGVDGATVLRHVRTHGETRTGDWYSPPLPTGIPWERFRQLLEALHNDGLLTKEIVDPGGAHELSVWKISDSFGAALEELLYAESGSDHSHT